MDVLGSVLTVGVVVLLWVAAVAFGRDTRDPGDWRRTQSIRDAPPRLGD
jgi:hypothetical protein